MKDDLTHCSGNTENMSGRWKAEPKPTMKTSDDELQRYTDSNRPIGSYLGV